MVKRQGLVWLGAHALAERGDTRVLNTSLVFIRDLTDVLFYQLYDEQVVGWIGWAHNQTQRSGGVVVVPFHIWPGRAHPIEQVSLAHSSWLFQFSYCRLPSALQLRVGIALAFGRSDPTFSKRRRDHWD